MPGDDQQKELQTPPAEAHEPEHGDGQRQTVAGGRTVTVSHDAVELRAPSGVLELRIRITEEGPVLQVEGVKVELRAAESVSVACKTFEVEAQEKVRLHSAAELDVSSEKELKITSSEDVRVNGKMIWLN